MAKRDDKRKKPENDKGNGAVTFIPSAYSAHVDCSGDACTITPASPLTNFPTDSSSTLSTPNQDLSYQNVSEVLPNDIWQMMKDAALKGCGLTFALTLSGQKLTDILSKRGYTANQIYWANQAVRALALYYAGASMPTVFGLQLAHYLMTENMRLDSTVANVFTSTASIAISFFNSSVSALEFTAVTGSALAGSVGGSRIAKISSILCNRFFGVQEERKPSEPQLAIYSHGLS